MKRKCTKCKQEKPLDAQHFYKRITYTGGFTPDCIECKRKKGREYQEKRRVASRWANVF